MRLQDEDFKIIDVLLRKSNLSVRKVAELTHMPTTTVHSHIKKLTREGVIKRFTLELDNVKMGKTIRAFVMINVNINYLKEHEVSQSQVSDVLIKHPFVTQSSSIAGRYDIIITIVAKDMTELNNFLMTHIRRNPGVQRTETFVELFKSEKGEKDLMLQQ